MSSNTSIKGITVYPFAERKEAVRRANNRHKLTGRQYADRQFEGGFLVEDLLTGELFDDGGQIPEVVAKTIRGDRGR